MRNTEVIVPSQQIVTAVDLDNLDDRPVHIGNCRVTTVYLTSTHRARAATRKRKKAKGNANQRSVQPEPEAQEQGEQGSEEAALLQQLGLPTAFGSTKGPSSSGGSVHRRRRETADHQSELTSPSTELPAANEETETATATSAVAHDTEAATGAQWQQAFDTASGCYYFYREATQETQWHPPDEGFIPAPYEWSAEAAHSWQDQQAAATNNSPTSQAEASVINQLQHNGARAGFVHTPTAADAGKHSSGATDANAKGCMGQAPPDGLHWPPVDQNHPNSGAVASSACSHGDSAMPPHRQEPLLQEGFQMASSAVCQQCNTEQQIHSTSQTEADVDGAGGANAKGLGADNRKRGVWDSLLALLHSFRRHHSKLGPNETANLQPRATPRMESTGLMPSIPSPTGSHIRFNDGDDDGSCTPATTPGSAEGLVRIAKLIPNAVLDTPTAAPPADLISIAEPSLAVDAASAQQSEVLQNACCTPGAELWGVHGAAAGVVGSDEVAREGVSGSVAIVVELAGGSEARRGADSTLPNGTMIKYWHQRYSLFSRFDEGIQLDHVGWYSVTPEAIARHQAARCACDTVVDAFAGVGGNAIALTAACRRVIAVELDSRRAALLRHNAGVYGVAGAIDVRCDDFFRLAPALQADIVFLSPPWGGPAYLKQRLFDLDSDLDGLGFPLRQLLAAARSALTADSPKGIVCFLPRNTDLRQLSELVDGLGPCEVERNVLDGHLKAVTVYLGDFEQP